MLPGSAAVGTKQRPSWADPGPTPPPSAADLAPQHLSSGATRRPPGRPSQGQRETPPAQLSPSSGSRPGERPLDGRTNARRGGWEPPAEWGGGTLSMVMGGRSRQGSRKLCGTRPPPSRLSGRPAPVAGGLPPPPPITGGRPIGPQPLQALPLQGDPLPGWRQCRGRKDLGEPQTDRGEERSGGPEAAGTRYLL